MKKDIILSTPPPPHPHQPTQQNVLTFLKVWQVLILPRIEQSILPRWVDPAQKNSEVVLPYKRVKRRKQCASFLLKKVQSSGSF